MGETIRKLAIEGFKSIRKLMVDLYGLGPGFSGHPPPDRFSNLDKVQHIENAIKSDICRQVPDDLRPDLRFIPYLQLHEYEGILFSDPAAFATGINRPNLERRFRDMRDEFDSPEDINNHAETAPSKRVLRVCPGCRKVIGGVQAASAVGIPAMRRHRRHFRAWIESIEALAATS